MELIAWSYDAAREHSPTPARLADLLARSRAAGYNALGLYLEHRFEYPSAPWAAAPGCLAPDAARALSRQARDAGIRLIPLLNTLGHMEGFLRAVGGEHLAEGRADDALSLQMCPSRPECREFARGLVEDALAAFDDEWVHLGGDETRQLGQCPACAARVRDVGRGGLYGEFFGPLCRCVIERGRRPCLWADMVLAHPGALEALPRQTVLFDWQYTHGPHETSARLRRAGFDVVCCPALRTFDAGWCFWPASRENVDAHADAARRLGALGVCLTTWEFKGFSEIDSVLPLVFAAGRRLARRDDWSAALAASSSDPGFVRAAELLGERVPAAATLLAPGTWRRLRELFVLRGDPFALWREWRAEAGGGVGDEILRLCDEIDRGLAPDSPVRFPVELHRAAVEWVRAVERAALDYGARRLDAAAAGLEHSIRWIERLRAGVVAAAERGGSRADVWRLERMIERVAAAVGRVRAVRAGALADDRGSVGACGSGHLPAFEVLTRADFVPGDQGAWPALVRA